MKVGSLDYYKSPWLSVVDLQGRPVRLTVAAVTLESVRNANGGRDEKLALGFLKTSKKLLLNKTQVKVLTAARGDDTDRWVGAVVVLQPARAQNGKDTIELLVMPPAAPQGAQETQQTPPQDEQAPEGAPPAAAAAGAAAPATGHVMEHDEVDSFWKG